MYEDILEKKELTRKDLTVLYIINALDKLRDMEIIEGGVFKITDDGREILGNFKPTTDELNDVLRLMKGAEIL